MVSDAPKLVLSLPSFTREYVQLPNRWMRDTRLSRRARGLLAELASWYDGKEIMMADLIESGPEGRAALDSAIRELEEHKYLTRRRLADRYGMKAGYEWKITDPGAVDNTTVENPHSGATTVENPHSPGTVENPHSLRTLNTSRSSSRGDYRARASETLAALAESRVYLTETCSHISAGSGRICGGRILRTDTRWCEFSHRQPEATT